MLLPVNKSVYSWSTPDPAEPWMMVGHLFIKDSGVVLIDPPLVPGLIEAVKRLGKLEAVVLTTQNHTRGTKYIAGKTGIPVYIPEQDSNSVDPREVINVKDLGKHETFSEGKVLYFESYKFGEDYALVSPAHEMLVGDNAIGDITGKLLPAPDWFYTLTDEERKEQRVLDFRKNIIGELKEIVRKSGAVSLLSSHGYDIIGDLGRKTEALK